MNDKMKEEKPDVLDNVLDEIDKRYSKPSFLEYTNDHLIDYEMKTWWKSKM